MNMSPEQAQEMAVEYTKAWCSHDPNAVAAFYAEDGSIVINDGEPSKGRTEIAAMAQAFYNDFPDLVVEMDDIRTSGTHAVYRWTLKGTNSGPDGTGNRVEISGWEYWRYTEDGLVAESSGHFDANDYQQQVDGA
ncbi:MAG: hypothetical protein DHS20C01_29680 [marine bacterium B5-7]|nr:MAG: hypothetical protein DHS20C01_29680 [marine bacterium B5-7]